MLAVAIGGALGAVARYSVALALAEHRFAYATLLVNLLGCFLIGLLLQGSLLATVRLPILEHPGVTIGFLGGLTTFSTFGYETLRLIENQQWLLALANVAANVLLGCGAVALGFAISRAVPGWMGAG